MKPVYTDLGEEYLALRESTGLIDYEGAGLFRVTGPSAATFVGAVSTRNVDFLLEGQISTALLLREDGTVLTEMLVYCNGTDYLLEVWPSYRDTAREHLTAAAAEHPDVAVTDVSDEHWMFGIEGPQSPKIAQRFLSFPIPSMAYRSFVATTWGDGVELVLSRTGVTGEYGYKVLVPAAHAAAVRAELVEAGAKECGSDALDICRMEMRFANLEREVADNAVTPFDLGLQWMVDFHHPFTGRDALVERFENGLERAPVCWTATDSGAEVPGPGAVVTCDGTEVGEVVHAVRSPKLDRVIGTARVDRSVAASGVEFTVGPDATPVRTVSAPFLVATSFGVPLE